MVTCTLADDWEVTQMEPEDGILPLDAWFSLGPLLSFLGRS